MLPTDDEIALINGEHFVKTPIKPADLLFVFGTRDGVEERIDVAHELWRDGYCPWLIVSGGLTPGSEFPECQVIKGWASRAGGPGRCLPRGASRSEYR